MHSSTVRLVQADVGEDHGFYQTKERPGEEPETPFSAMQCASFQAIYLEANVKPAITLPRDFGCCDLHQILKQGVDPSSKATASDFKN